MKKTLVFLFISPQFVIAATTTIDVGGTSIIIPYPKGFVPVTAEFVTLKKVLDSLTPSTNKRFSSFIDEKQMGQVLGDEVPALVRTFNVQTSRRDINALITNTDFGRLKEFLKKDLSDLMKQVEKEIPGIVDQLNKNIEKQFDIDMGLKIANMVPLPVHEESDRSVSYSVFAKQQFSGEKGETEIYVSVSTITMVHVKGKLLSLYCYGDHSDLQWSRQNTNEWTEAIIAANPSDFGTAIQETVPVLGGINWAKVLEKAMIGAIVGAVIGLLGYLIKRKKKSV